MSRFAIDGKAVEAMGKHSVGDAVAQALADIGVRVAFGIASIHNLPLLDAISRQKRIRFIMARGEAGAMNMADGFARVSRSLGVAITSTGTGAGNAIGGQMEALVAGSPLLHITSQVDRELVDRDRAPLHDVPRQADVLRAASKAFHRIWHAEGAADTIVKAASEAMTAPMGPVTVEIPVDVQRQSCNQALRSSPLPSSPRMPDPDQIDRLAARLIEARRPMLWLGGGARQAKKQVAELVDRGFAAVTSGNGRGSIREGHPASLGAYATARQSASIFQLADVMLVIGSRLRGNETLNYKLPLPPLVQIDVDPTQAGRNYPVEQFIWADAAAALDALLPRLPKKLDVDDAFLESVAEARRSAASDLLAGLGPYQTMALALDDIVQADRHPFVRDVTIANATFGSRYVRLGDPHLGVHAAGGGIGQGVAMAIGAALAGESAKTIALIGDGGAQLALGEFATAVESRAEIAFILMNDGGYGVIRNIQDASYGGRQAYADLLTPDFSLIAKAINMPHYHIEDIRQFPQALRTSLDTPGCALIEIDMNRCGPFAQPFTGSPTVSTAKR